MPPASVPGVRPGPYPGVNQADRHVMIDLDYRSKPKWVGYVLNTITFYIGVWFVKLIKDKVTFYNVFWFINAASSKSLITRYKAFC